MRVIMKSATVRMSDVVRILFPTVSEVLEAIRVHTYST